MGRASRVPRGALISLPAVLGPSGSAKTRQRGRKRVTGGPKRPPRRLPDGPEALQDSAKLPKSAPRRPRWPQDGPGSLQDGPRRPQDASQEGPKRHTSLIFIVFF